MLTTGLAIALLATAPANPLEELRKSAEEARACSDLVVENGTRVRVYRGDRACVAFDDARSYEGVWVYQFEGSRFYEGATSLADLPEPDPRVWFSTDAETQWPDAPVERSGRAYRVRFVGRQAADMDRKPLFGYGHFGASAGLVLVDRFEQLEDIGSAYGDEEYGPAD